MDLFELQHQKVYLQTCGPSEDSDQPAHLRSLIKIFTDAWGIAKDAKFLHADNEDYDQTVQMCRLI